MRQSTLFTKTRKNPPSDEVSQNAKLLIQAGFIHKEMAGVYSYLPLGLRVRNNIEEIIREEMNAAGGQELALTTLQSKDVWEKTSRWIVDDDELWFKSELVNGGEVGLAWSHEDPLTHLLTQHVSSYKDLPIYTYQFQTKLRNELRAKSGILRGREFLMKDLYSFSRSEEEHEEFYEKMKHAYERVFERVGIGDKTYFTRAGGGTFTEGYSDEFQTICEAGEDTIYVNDEKNIAVNEEALNDETLEELGLSRDGLREETTIEVGNIFPLGTKYSEPLGLTFKDESGEEKPVIMGSYGIGLGRLMGTVVEIFADDDGLVWPESIAPFDAHLLVLGGDDEVRDAAESLYKALKERDVDVLFDDRDVSAGEKFADADLIGVPFRLVVSQNTVEEDKVEVKRRLEENEELVTPEALFETLENTAN